MITSLKEILELPKFDDVNTSTRWFESRNKFFGDVMDINYGVIIFILKYLFLRELREANFADIIKTESMFI